MSALSDYQHSNMVRAVLYSLAELVCPPHASTLLEMDTIVDHVELSMRSFPTSVRLGLLAGISSYEFGAMLIPRHRGKRASRLSASQARLYFASWYHARLLPQHEFAKGIKSLLCLACYEQPEMMESIGYRPAAWIEKSRTYRLKTYSKEINEAHRSRLKADPLPGVQSKEERP